MIRCLMCALTITLGVYLPTARCEEIASLRSEKYRPECQVEVAQEGALVVVAWTSDEASGERLRVAFDLAPDRPLVHSIARQDASGNAYQAIAAELDPVYELRTGERDLKLRGGWTIFFDRMQNKPHRLQTISVSKQVAKVSSHANRATIEIGPVTAGPFQGNLRWTFFAGQPLVLQEAVLATSKNAVAYLYDAGLVCRGGLPEQLVWHAAGSGETVSIKSAEISGPRHADVRGRAVAAEFAHGAVAVFPPPHRYFYPLDYSTNLKNVWIGPHDADSNSPLGFGLRHDPRGDNRFVPWFNAPPGSEQRLGLFWNLSGGSAEESLASVARLTRQDRFEPLPGHVVFSSHYHVEHTRTVLEAQRGEPADGDAKLKLPGGGEYRVPPRLRDPGFARVFRDMGIDVVQLAEFHFGETPGLNTAERLRQLELMHAECARLSDDKLLLLPGEEPNVHLGGHWISLFPQPVYWVLNRPGETPFVQQHERLGKVYHVGSEADVYRLLQAEQGLAWTAHPRIKGSTGFPDAYRRTPLFESDRFLGAAWKAMPADLSQPRLGSRVLDLLDDMANWGHVKYVLGEVDVFQIEPDHELYGHMNVNYLRLDRVPRFDESWQPILDALSSGQFFVTTGEVLIADFQVNGRRSGAKVELTKDPAEVALDLKWTFPLHYAEIITGDGKQVRRQRIDLSDTGAFGEKSLKLPVDLAGQRWLRVEVWDVATNGAFMQPVWIERK